MLCAIGALVGVGALIGKRELIKMRVFTQKGPSLEYGHLIEKGSYQYREAY